METEHTSELTAAALIRDAWDTDGSDEDKFMTAIRRVGAVIVERDKLREDCKRLRTAGQRIVFEMRQLVPEGYHVCMRYQYDGTARTCDNTGQPRCPLCDLRAALAETGD